jgi:hypothetical protein
VHVDPDLNVTPAGKDTEMAFFLAETDQLFVLCASVGTVRARKVQSFQKIGLALGIVSVKDVHAVRKIQMQTLVISVIFKVCR